MNRYPAPCQTRWLASLLLALICSWVALPEARAQAAPAIPTAPVVVDGKTLFYLRGVSAFPAEKRAAQVRANIVAAADDEAIGLDQFRIEEFPDRSDIYAGTLRLLTVHEVDAAVESVQRPLLAMTYLGAIVQAVAEYRAERSFANLGRNGLYALGATGLILLLVWVFRWVFRKLDGWLERNVKRNVQALANKSHQLIHAGTVWSLVGGLLKLFRVLVYLLIAYFYLNLVLGLFPWTRPAARMLFSLVLNPLESLGRGFLAAIPNIVFLVVLWFVVRYVLRVIRAFFTGVASGRIKLERFQADWAPPTYRIVRILVIAFAIVVAYPYIPGSDSAAFKGVSVFLGVLLSLGSSSFIANMVAGLSMTYRGAFHEGDLIRVGDTIGHVEDIKLMTTRLRTPKNEIVILPNSNVLSNDVTNFSQVAGTEGLILHSTVGIGYDTPWRQVEAMLLEAASRTAQLKSDPAPFVLQSELGDFAVNYQINAYWSGSGSLPRIRSDLHANIQDVFNEYGVQIMSPAYEADPATAKVVPPDKWYETPAKKP